MNRRDFLTTSSKVACACALGAGSLLTKSCSNPNEPSTPIDSTGVELDFDLTTDEFIPLQIDGGSVATGSNEIDSAGLLLLRSGDNIKAFAGLMLRYIFCNIVNISNFTSFLFISSVTS